MSPVASDVPGLSERTPAAMDLPLHPETAVERITSATPTSSVVVLPVGEASSPIPTSDPESPKVARKTMTFKEAFIARRLKAQSAKAKTPAEGDGDDAHTAVGVVTMVPTAEDDQVGQFHQPADVGAASAMDQAPGQSIGNGTTEGELCCVARHKCITDHSLITAGFISEESRFKDFRASHPAEDLPSSSSPPPAPSSLLSPLPQASLPPAGAQAQSGPGVLTSPQQLSGPNALQADLRTSSDLGMGSRMDSPCNGLQVDTGSPLLGPTVIPRSPMRLMSVQPTSPIRDQTPDRHWHPSRREFTPASVRRELQDSPATSGTRSPLTATNRRDQSPDLDTLIPPRSKAPSTPPRITPPVDATERKPALKLRDRISFDVAVPSTTGTTPIEVKHSELRSYDRFPNPAGQTLPKQPPTEPRLSRAAHGLQVATHISSAEEGEITSPLASPAPSTSRSAAAAGSSTVPTQPRSQRASSTATAPVSSPPPISARSVPARPPPTQPRSSLLPIAPRAFREGTGLASASGRGASRAAQSSFRDGDRDRDRDRGWDRDRDRQSDDRPRDSRDRDRRWDRDRGAYRGGRGSGRPWSGR